MSNFLTIAMVSAAFQRLLAPGIHDAVSGADVWIDRPDIARETPGANIYLYGVSVSSALGREALPARQELPTRGGGARAGSTMGWDLHYLLTFYGDEAQLEPQRLLGAAVAALLARPVITASLVTEVLTAAADTEPQHSYLVASDLGAAAELVGLSPDPVTVEELTGVWSLFAPFPYRLSTTYVARSVTLSSADEP